MLCLWVVDSISFACPTSGPPGGSKHLDREMFCNSNVTHQLPVALQLPAGTRIEAFPPNAGAVSLLLGAQVQITSALKPAH